MRSVIVHLWRTGESEVTAWLDRSYTKDGSQWLAEVDGDPCLYIHFYHDGAIEDESWRSRFSEFGGLPAVSVIADISGRHEGWPETRKFVVGLLSAFEGVAVDDGAERFWSRDEVAEDRIIRGRPFGYWRFLPKRG